MRTNVLAFAAFLGVCAGDTLAQEGKKAAPAISPHALALVQIVEGYQLAKPGSNAANEWNNLVSRLDQLEGMSRLYVVEHPDAFAGEEGKMSNDLREAFRVICAGATDEREKRLAQSGREFIAYLESLGFFAWLDTLPQAERFVAPPILHGGAWGPMPQHGPSRTLASCCAARMHLLAQAADWGACVQTFEDALAVGRGLNGQCDLLTRPVADVDQSMVISEVKAQLLAGKIGSETAQNLLAAIDRQPLPRFAFALEGERATGLQVIDEFYDEVEAESSKKAVADIAPIIGNRKDETKVWNEYFDAWAKFFGGDEAAKAEASKNIDKILALRDSSEGEKRYAVVSQLIPTVRLHVPRSFDAQRDGLRVMLALEIWRSQHAGYPEKLDELTPAILPNVPRDPFDCSQPLRYRRDGDAKYLLYSVGFDGKDDSGKLCPAGNFAAGAPWKSGCGYDYILNIAER
jgi:hypothetical protein